MAELRDEEERFQRGFREHIEWGLSIWPEIDPDTESIVNGLDMASRRIQRASVKTLGQLGVARGEFWVLMHMMRGQTSPAQIAGELMVSTGTMTNRLDKLEKAGLVRRHPDPKDRRSVMVEITARGRATVDRYVKVQGDIERRLLGHLSPAERRRTVALLVKLLASMEVEGASGGRHSK